MNPYRTLSRLFILPFAMSKKYVRANFIVSGTIQLRHRTAIPFVLKREFEKGRLGEKAICWLAFARKPCMSHR